MSQDGKRNIDHEARAAIEGRGNGTVEPGGSKRGGPAPSDDRPPAGTHADPSLINPNSTPGTGALTPPGGHDDVDSTSG